MFRSPTQERLASPTGVGVNARPAHITAKGARYIVPLDGHRTEEKCHSGEWRSPGLGEQGVSLNFDPCCYD
jgi:hypothetical protein